MPWENIESDKVELIIGADTQEAFWMLEERKRKPKEPYAIRRVSGWFVMGPTSLGSDKMSINRI